MAFKKMNHVWDGVPHVKPAVKLFLMAIADQADDDGYCWPGIELLHTRANISKRSAINHLETLENFGDLYVNRRAGRVNRYIVMTGTTRDEFLRAATDPGRLGMDDDAAIQAWESVRTREQAAFASGAKSAPPGSSADSSPVQNMHHSPEVGATRAKSALVQEPCTTPVQAVAPDPLIPKENGIQGIQENWSSFLELVASQTSKDVFHASFQGSRPAAIDESVLVIETPGQRETDWINNRVGEIALSAFLAANPGTDIEKLWARPWRSK